jgi:hypothetical protein
MAFWRVLSKRSLFYLLLATLSGTAPLAICAAPAQSTAQRTGKIANKSLEDAFSSSNSTLASASVAGGESASNAGGMEFAAGSELASSDPAPAMGHSDRQYPVAPAEIWAQPPLSRVGLSTDISPLGVGMKGVLLLTHYVDARLTGSFFQYNGNRSEIEGFNVYPSLHLASMAASLDWYPFGSIWRISPGIMFYNSNQLSMKADLAPGTEIDLGQYSFYAPSSTVLGSTPFNISGVVGLHSRPVAARLSGGFGPFIPRSNRHWSYPSEFGVILMGAPTLDVNTSGWICTDVGETNCGDVASTTNPAAIAFQQALQTKLVSWRKSLGEVTVYPIISFGVSYSFNIR